MKVKTIRSFKDLLENVQRNKGDVFEVTEERLAAINGTYSFPLVEALEPPESDQEEETGEETTEPETEPENAAEEPEEAAEEPEPEPAPAKKSTRGRKTAKAE